MLTKLNYFEEQIAKFLEEDREDSKSYGEIAEFQAEITEEFLTWVKEDNNTFYSDVEVITEWLSELRENAMDYISIEAYHKMMSELLEDKISEYDDLLEDTDRREEWARDYADNYGLDESDTWYDIDEIDCFFLKPSELMECLNEVYHGERYFRIDMGWVDFDNFGTDWDSVFDDYDVKKYVQNGDLINTDDVVDLGADITDLEESIALIEDLLNE